MDLLKNANLALRFLLELAALAALAAWGFQVSESWLIRLPAAVVAPSVAAIAWGLAVSPKARLSLHWAARLAVEVAVFLAAAAGLALSGQASLAAALLVIAFLSRAIKAAFDLREGPD